MKVRTARGEIVDMLKYLDANAEQIALGNAKMNARGDIVGPGGRIVTKAEDISSEYHRANPQSTLVRQVALASLASEVFQTPAEAMASLKEATKAQAPAPAADKTAPVTKKRRLTDDE